MSSKEKKKGVVPKLRFPEFRDAGPWKVKRLGEICDITTGKLDANAMVSNGKYRFYTCAKEYYFVDEYAFDTEALLISGNGAYVGYIHYYKGKFNAYQRTYVLDKFKHNIIFIKYFLEQNLPKRIEIEKKDGNTPYIVLSTLTNMKIFLPSLSEEQQKITDCLSSLDEVIELETKKLEALKAHKKGLMQKLFPQEGETLPRLRFPEFTGEWEEARLGEIAAFSKGKGISKSDIDNDGKYKCIHYGELFTTYNEIIKIVHSKTNKNKDPVISEGNETLIPTSDVTPKGLATASALNEKGVIIGGDILIIKSDILFNNYLSYYINANKRQILKFAVGATVYHIYANDIKKLHIKFPSFSEQQKIAGFLSSIDELIELQTKKIKALKIYKKGLMQQLFPREV